MTSFAECVAIAESVGFTTHRATQVCSVAQGESGIGADTRCACQACCDSSCTSGCGPYYHDAECQAQGMTGHCGVFQMDQSNPQFAQVIQSGCAYDLTCSLKAMFGITQGGACFDHPNPWSPHFGFGNNYGGCAGSADPGLAAPGALPSGSTLQGSGGQKPCTGDPRTWIDCNIQLPGTGGANDPLGALSAIGDFLHNLSSPNLWTRVGIVIAGTLAIAIGLFALTREEAGGGRNVTVRVANGAGPRPTQYKQSGSIFGE